MNDIISNVTSDVTTALAIVIPEEFVDKINMIRSKYDKAFIRWMPHINLVFPFVSETHFDNVEQILISSLENFNSFNLILDEIGYFDQGNYLNIHLKSSEDNDLLNLHRIILNSLNIKNKRKYHPHMTLGQISKDDNINEFYFDKISFTVNTIHILQRFNDEPFIIVRSIKL